MSMEQAAVTEDLSAFIIAGRLKSHIAEKPQFESTVRTPAMGIQDGVDAEKLGFRRVFLADRPELKEPATILGGVAALTKRLGVGTGIIAAGSRHPMVLASMGATMQAAYGPRFTLGLGRGQPSYGHGGHMPFKAFSDVCTIVKRLWAGEKFEYEGPAGSFGTLHLRDRYEGPQPDILYGGFGLPMSAKAIAETPAIDGILFPAMMTPLGVKNAARHIREACERSGRDPATVRLIAEVVTAPDLSDEETRQLCHARAVTYFQPEWWSRAYESLNEWDPAVMTRMRQHPQFSGLNGAPADLAFHRVQLMEPAQLIPDAWMQEACAIGSVDDCVRKIQEFRDAGADEITTYGSTPQQNAKLIEAWRQHTASRRAHSRPSR